MDSFSRGQLSLHLPTSSFDFHDIQLSSSYHIPQNNTNTIEQAYTKLHVLTIAWTRKNPNTKNTHPPPKPWPT